MKNLWHRVRRCWLVRLFPWLALPLCLALVLAIEFVSSFIVTLSVETEGEAMQFELSGKQQTRWRLPPGLYAVEGSPEGPGSCAGDDARPPSCLGSTLLEARGRAAVRIEILAGGRLLLELSPAGASPIDVRVLNAAGGELHRAEQDLAFESASPVSRMLLPLIVDRATMGALLHETALPLDPLMGAAPPLLLGGRVRIFAAKRSDRERYVVLDETLDRGDVATLVGEPALESGMGAIRGFLTIEQRSDGDQKPVIKAVLHTSASDDPAASPYPRLHVQHFGATREHVFGVTRWHVVSKLPRAQELWVSLVSIILIGSFLAQVIDTSAGCERKGGDDVQ